MKKLFVISIGILLLILFVSFYNQNATYYYAFNKKVELKVVDNKLVVRYKHNLKRDINNALQNQLFGKYQIEWRDDSTLVVITDNKTESSELFGNLKRQSDVKTCNAVYRVDSGGELDITDEFIVRFKETVTQSQIDSIHKNFGVQVVKSDKIYQLVKVRDGEDALKTANQYQESGLTIFSHPNAYSRIEAFETIPNDTYFNMQFYLKNTGQVFNDGHAGTPGADIKATKTWDITKGNNSIVIAVLDMGVTADHPDLPNTRQVRLSGSNFTSNGTPDDPSALANDNHGNCCAGVIAATQDNTQGITGIAPQCKIMPVKIMWDKYYSASYEAIAQAILFASRNGAHIISNSWGYGDFTDPNQFPVIVNAIWEAGTIGRNGLGCIITFAAGNNAAHNEYNIGSITFPSNVTLSTVLTVGASERYDQQANYSPTSVPGSSYNQIIDIVAPSNKSMPWLTIPDETYEVWSIDIPGFNGDNPWKGLNPPARHEELPNWGTNYSSFTGRFGGTSAACPEVAAVAALILSVNPKLTHFEVYDIITRTADKVGGYTYTNGRSNELGFGRLNSYRAISQAVTITGADVLCSAGSYKIHNINDLPADWNVTWSVSPSNIASLNQTQDYITLTPLSKGKLTITANLQTQYPSDSRTITKDIWVGMPNTPVITGSSTLSCGATATYFLNNTIPQPSNVIFHWYADGLQIVGASNQKKCIVTAIGGPTATLYCSAYDGCSENGSYSVVGSFVVNTDCWSLALYPNPATEYVEVGIIENVNMFDGFTNNCEVRVFDNLKHQVKYYKTTQKSFRLELSELISGIYFVQVKYRGKIETQQIILSK